MRIIAFVIALFFVFLLGGCQQKVKPVKKMTRVNAKDGAVMAFIPAGEFKMGASKAFLDKRKNTKPEVNGNIVKDKKTQQKLIEQSTNFMLPQRTVYLNDFYMYVNDVTVEQYRRFCEITSRKMPKESTWKWRDNDPIVNVTWDDAKAYAVWAGGDLPTEAEWEKAARGGDDRLYIWGDDKPLPVGAGNFSDMARKREMSIIRPGAFIYAMQYYYDGYVYVSPVGTFTANPYGLCDLAGNVENWCTDWYDPNYYKYAPNNNPTGPPTPIRDEGKVVRGSSWASGGGSPEFRKSSKYKNSHIGFRCVVHMSGQ